MPERRRGSTGWLYTQGLLFAMVLIALLSALSGCGPEQTNVGQTNGNNVPVSLNISMPQESAAASTSGSRFWATVQSWLPSVTNAWAETYDLSELTVSVTDSDQQLLATKTEKISSSHDSGESISIDLDVPVGSDRIFAVSGIDRGSGLPILQGKSNPVTLIEGKPATVPITLADVGQPTISDPPSLPVGVVGTPYSATLTATGGTPPYRWSVTPPLPAVLTFNPAGSTATIGGTPRIANTTTHIFSVTDSTSPTPRTGTRRYPVTIAPPGLSIATSSLPNGTVMRPYNTTVTAAGGTPPYRWSIADTDPTPAPGLSLSPSGPTAGQITGTPGTNAGSPFTRTYQVQDSAVPPRTATQSLSIAVNLPSPPKIPPQTLPNGAFKQPYNQTLKVEGGTPPFIWSIITGTLPTGLSLNRSTGEIAGTAGATGTFRFTANVTDATGQTDPSPPALSITITLPPPPTITTRAPLPTGTVNQPYLTTTLTAKDGVPPLSWFVSPALPNGLTLNPDTATISGTPLSASGPTTYFFTVVDSAPFNHQSDGIEFLLTINSALTIDTTSPLPTGKVGNSYIGGPGLRASGGTPPHDWSIVGGGPTPAPGLTLSNEKGLGIIQGKPILNGSFTRTYRVQDSKGEAATKSLTLNVSDLTITTTELPDGAVGCPYFDKVDLENCEIGSNVMLSASGGTGQGTYTWSIDDKDAKGNPLPPAPGLILSDSGVITGRPKPGGSFARTYHVQDGKGVAVTKSLTIAIGEIN